MPHYLAEHLRVPKNAGVHEVMVDTCAAICPHCWMWVVELGQSEWSVQRELDAHIRAKHPLDDPEGFRR